MLYISSPEKVFDRCIRWYYRPENIHSTDLYADYPGLKKEFGTDLYSDYPGLKKEFGTDLYSDYPGLKKKEFWTGLYSDYPGLEKRFGQICILTIQAWKRVLDRSVF